MNYFVKPSGAATGVSGLVRARNPAPPPRLGADRSGAAPLMTLVPRSIGSRLATPHGGAIHAIHPPGLQAADPKHHIAEILLSPVPRVRAARRGEAEQEFDAASGSLLISPVRMDSHVTWPSVRESVIVALTEDALRTLATHEFDTAGVELRPPPFGTVDSWALRIGQLLKAELTQREVPNELYVDSLITLFGVHILRHYSNVRRPPLVTRGGLSASVARRLQDYIDNNLSHSLPVAELAGMAGLSVRHFIQAFTRSFGEPPHRYVVDRRLGFAEKLLTRGDLTIAEVAYQSGFSSQSHLTTTMKKHRQKTPLQVRRER
jgi:AraC family transcriptional regulator